MLSNNIYGFIYKSTLPNGKFYIGQHKIISKTTLDPTYVGSGILIKAYIKIHGKAGIIREILEYAYSREELNELELKYVNNELLNDENCLNLDTGGRTTVRSLEANKRISIGISKARKENPEKWPNRYGSDNNKSKHWKIISPDGTEYLIHGGLQKFCDINGISYHGIVDAYKKGYIPNRGSSKNWKLINVECNVGSSRPVHNKGEYRAGKNNPMYGKTHSDDTINNMIVKMNGNKINTRPYQITTPAGIKFQLQTTVKQFCLENNIPKYVIARYVNTNKSYNGWFFELSTQEN